MFEKVSQAAERVATGLSRRGFLGRLGRGALGVAAALGGVLALPGQARAAGGRCCCGYNPYRDEYYCYRTSGSCAAGESRCNCRKGCK